MNLIVETIRKSDAFEILITSSRGGSQLRNESVGALFLFQSPRVAPGLAGRAALVVPSLKGFLVEVMWVFGCPVRCAYARRAVPFLGCVA